VNGYRDERLGALLRELDVPEHGRGFETELRRRLAQERRVTRLPAPRRRVGLRIRLAAVAAVAAAVAAVVAIGIPTTDH
jgi:hypothetical protein